jgi:P-type Mg2+ transporter
MHRPVHRVPDLGSVETLDAGAIRVAVNICVCIFTYLATCIPFFEGFTQSEAEKRARMGGPNEVAPEHRQGWVLRLLKIIRNPLVILLAVLSMISFATGDARAGIVMAGMVVLSVALRFWQEARADAAATKLKAMIHVTATVLRDGNAREMRLRDLVAGDIIKLSAGDMIPGDVRVISSKDLFVSQGTLTGESLPVEKFHQPEGKALPSPTELKLRCDCDLNLSLSLGRLS